MKHLISVIIIIALLNPANGISTATFCSSECATCTSPWPSDCSLCQAPFAMSSGVCSVSGQTTIFTQQLMMYSTFTPVGYQSNSTLSVIKCTGLFDYYMLGTLGSNTYIRKMFASLGTNHYQVTVLYGYALMGITPWTLQLSLFIVDGSGSNTVDLQTPACTPDGLYGCLWSVGCYSNYAVPPLASASDNITLTFSLASAVAAGQAWGIRDVVIILSTCDASCGTCSGPTALNCLTCASGLFFSGAICISACPYYTISDYSTCTISCPSYYFLNTVNSFCERCPEGCSICTSQNQCITWDSNYDPSNRLFYDLIPVWIIIAIIGFTIIGMVIWKVFLSKKSFHSKMEEEVIDHKPALADLKATQINNSQLMESNWIQDLDDLHMNKRVKNKVIKDKIEGIGHRKYTN